MVKSTTLDSFKYRLDVMYMDPVRESIKTIIKILSLWSIWIPISRLKNVGWCALFRVLLKVMLPLRGFRLQLVLDKDTKYTHILAVNKSIPEVSANTPASGVSYITV